MNSLVGDSGTHGPISTDCSFKESVDRARIPFPFTLLSAATQDLRSPSWQVAGPTGA